MENILYIKFEFYEIASGLRFRGIPLGNNDHQLSLRKYNQNLIMNCQAIAENTNKLA